MLTLNELIEVLKIRYTPEELIDILGISSEILTESLELYIEEHYEEIHDRLISDGFIDVI